jgi:hypothetical protein
MPAHYLNIEARQRTHFGRLASIEDFTVSAGATVDAGIILTNPNISLYCFDVETERVFFVELPDDVDLSTAPFVYQTQYEQARRLIETDTATFRQLARQLPKIENLIIIYSCGRSGSTLLSNALNVPACVFSLSEPDAATQLLRMRLEKRLPDADLHEMTDCTVRMLFKPMRFKTPTHYVLKPRSEGIQMMDWFQASFPQVKNLFSYRDALGFVSSYYRILKNTIFPERQTIEEFATFFHRNTRQDLTYLTVYLDAGTTILDLPQQLTLWWLAMMEWYMEQVGRTIPALAVPYAQLNRQREAVLKAIFDYCGLPETDIREALSVFEHDAQEGTLLARENAAEGNQLRLTDEERAQVLRILARHPVIKTPDFVVPGTPLLPT